MSEYWVLGQPWKGFLETKLSPWIGSSVPGRLILSLSKEPYPNSKEVSEYASLHYGNESLYGALLVASPRPPWLSQLFIVSSENDVAPRTVEKPAAKADIEDDLISMVGTIEYSSWAD